MGSSWRKELRVGVIQVMMFPEAAGDGPRTVETARRLLRDDFFGALVVGRMDPETTRTVKAMAEDAGVALAINAAPVLLGGKHSLANLEEGSRRAAVQALRASVDDASALGAPMVELFDGAGSYPGPEGERRATDQLVRSLVELCRYAQDRATDRPLWIVLESFDRFVDKRSLVGPTSLAVEVAARVRAEQSNFGLTIDMGHLPLIGEGYRDALNLAKDYLVHVHLGSCVKGDPNHRYHGDTHPCFGLEGGFAGMAELREFLRALKGAGYFEKPLPTGDPWVSFEVKPRQGQDPELLIANCRRTFEGAWAGL